MFGTNSENEPRKTAAELDGQPPSIPLALPNSHPGLVDFSVWIDQKLEQLLLDFASFQTTGSNLRHFRR